MSLTDRVRALLTDEPTLREVRMFGGLSFMVRDRMVVAARRGRPAHPRRRATPR